MNANLDAFSDYPTELMPFIADTMQQSLLEKLLHGRAREIENLPKLLDVFGLRFRSDRFFVLGLRLCGESRQPGKWTPPPEPDLHGMARDRLSQLNGWDSWSLLTNELFVAILCRSGTDGASGLQTGNDLVAFLSAYHPVCVAVSEEKIGLGGINDGFYEMLEVLGVIDMQNRENVALSFSDLDAETYQSMDTTFERDRRLINAVLEGDRDQTYKALTQMECSALLDSRNSLMLEKRRLLGVVNQMVAEITVGGNCDFLTDLDAFRTIMDAPANEQLQEAFKSVCLSLCDYYDKTQEDVSASRAMLITDYIDRHFMNPELSLDTLSAIFKISPSYLSRIFKREKQISVITYMQSKRIARASYLLTSSGLRIREIAKQVGYLNEQTFTRSFKAVTGLTPSVYREERR